MPNYLAIYVGTATAREKADWQIANTAERQQRQEAGVQAWGEWVARHQDAIVDIGTPLGPTKRISGDGIADTHNTSAAYVIVKAASLGAAAQMFEGHPHFSILPGDSVEVMECLPLPGGKDRA